MSDVDVTWFYFSFQIHIVLRYLSHKEKSKLEQQRDVEYSRELWILKLLRYGEFVNKLLYVKRKIRTTLPQPF